MNRQIRRDQKRKEEKQEKEKDKKRAERRKRRQDAQASRARRKSEGGEAEAKPKRTGGKMPGRFSGVLAAATVFFIILQSLVPAEDTGVLNTVVSAGFYLLFGYFSTLWLLRRQTPRAVGFSLVSGAMLGLGVELGKYLRPEMSFDPLLAVMIVPALVIGVLLGRLVFYNAPA